MYLALLKILLSIWKNLFSNNKVMGSVMIDNLWVLIGPGSYVLWVSSDWTVMYSGIRWPVLLRQKEAFSASPEDLWFITLIPQLPTMI